MYALAKSNTKKSAGKPAWCKASTKAATKVIYMSQIQQELSSVCASPALTSNVTAQSMCSQTSRDCGVQSLHICIPVKVTSASASGNTTGAITASEPRSAGISVVQSPRITIPMDTLPSMWCCHLMCMVNPSTTDVSTANVQRSTLGMSENVGEPCSSGGISVVQSPRITALLTRTHSHCLCDANGSCSHCKCQYQAIY